MVAALFMDAVGVVDPRTAAEDHDVALVVPVFGRVEVVVGHDVERLALADLLHRLVGARLEASARNNPALLVGDAGGRLGARRLRFRLGLPLRGLRARHRPGDLSAEHPVRRLVPVAARRGEHDRAEVSDLVASLRGEGELLRLALLHRLRRTPLAGAHPSAVWLEGVHSDGDILTGSEVFLERDLHLERGVGRNLVWRLDLEPVVLVDGGAHQEREERERGDDAEFRESPQTDINGLFSHDGYLRIAVSTSGAILPHRRQRHQYTKV